jgi:hypothetical protein
VGGSFSRIELLALCFAVLSSLACSPGETHRPEPVVQRESWYHHFHALPGAHELVGYNPDTTDL